VRLGEDEVRRIARHLRMEEREFVNRFTRLRPSRDGLALIEKEDGSCIFLEGRNVCTIQEVKPVQCSSFPNAWRFPGWREQCEAVEEGSREGTNAS
jgi:hypothetical protein